MEIGQKVGEIKFSINGEVIASTNLIAKESVKKLNVGNMLARILENWFTLFR